MSKQIDWDQPLDDFDRKYALQRGMQKKVAENDERFGAPEVREKTLPQAQEELAQARQRVYELEALVSRLANPNVASPPPAHGTFPPVQGTAIVAPVDNTVVDGVAPEGAPVTDQYDGWNKIDMEEEIDERNQEEDRADEDKIKRAGTKAELADRLRADDARRAQA